MKISFHQKAFLQKCSNCQGKATIFIFLLFLFSMAGYSQNTITVKGKVTDDVGQPVVGASVVVKGEQNGVLLK